jgi:hypothetical protein
MVQVCGKASRMILILENGNWEKQTAMESMSGLMETDMKVNFSNV